MSEGRTEPEPFAFPEGFADAYYLINVTADKFRADEFWQAVGVATRAIGAGVAFFASEAESSHFAVLSWTVNGTGELSFRLEYVPGFIDGRVSPHTKVSAEQLVQWFGSFFKYDTVQSHLHATFTYSLHLRRSTYPLPVRTNFGDADEQYEIYGIWVRLPSRPYAVTSVRLTQSASQWFVEIIAHKRIAFKKFSPDGDMKSVCRVINNFLEAKP